MFAHGKRRDKRDVETEINVLKLELDYELASLSLALNRNDTKEIEKSKQRLKEIQSELEILENKKGESVR